MSKRTRYCIVAGVSAAGAGAAIAAVAAAVGLNASPAQAGPPRIAFDLQYHDLGQVAPDEKLQVAFPFRNAGGERLEILKAKASCGCTVVEEFKRELAPNESDEITVTFDAGSVPKGVRHSIWVDTNDPAHPRVTLQVRALVRAGFQVVPDTVHFAELAPGQTVERIVELIALDGNPFKITEVDPGSSYVSASFDLDVNRTVHRGTVRLRATDRRGYVRDSLSFRTTHPSRPRAGVRISAQVAGKVVANPDRIHLTGITQGATAKTRALLVSRDRETIDVDNVASSNEFWGLAWKTTEAGQPYITWLELDLRPPWVTGQADTEIRVNFAKPAALSVQIPVEAIVEETLSEDKVVEAP